MRIFLLYIALRYSQHLNTQLYFSIIFSTKPIPLLYSPTIHNNYIKKKTRLSIITRKTSELKNICILYFIVLYLKRYITITPKTKEKTMKKSYLTYIIALLLFGSNGIVASNIHLTSYNIVLLRTMIGSILLVAIFFLTKHKPTFMHHKRDLIFIIISGIAMGGGWMFLYEAYAQIGVGIASLLYYCGPVFVMALSPLIFKEKLTLVKISGFVAVLIGIVFISGNIFDGKANLFGIFCGLASAVAYTVMVTTNKKATNITGMENSVIQLIFSFLTVAVFVGIKGGYAMSILPGDIIWILILGLVNTGLGCWFYFASIGSLPVQTVAICGYIEPLSAVLFSVILLGEQMNILQIIGAVLIIGGAVFSECFKEKKSIKT